MAFFEQIGKRLTDAGQNVAQQTKDFADVTKLNNAISEKEKKISQIFSLIGQSYYERHKNDSYAEELDKISEVNSLYSDIFKNREQIKQIKGIVKCPKCGADLPLNAAFCNICGAKIEKGDIENEKNNLQRHCPICQSIVNDDDLFCNNCGAKIENQ